MKCRRVFKMKKIREKIILVFILLILIFANIASAVKIYDNTNLNKIQIGNELEFTIDFGTKIQTADFSVQFDNEKLEYNSVSTEDLKTNYIAEQDKILCCYYDLTKIGTDKIILKFKAKAETNKTNIKITNITVHTKTEEKTIPDITSENIKIIKPFSDLTNNIIENNIISNNQIKNNTTENNTTNNGVISNNINNIINNNTDSNIVDNKNNKKEENKTISVKPILKTGVDFKFGESLIILITLLIFILILKNEQLPKKTKIILAIIIILIGSITFLSKFVFATNDDKILINKKNKSILIVLSTSNESRSMTIKDFKEKTQATNIDKKILAQTIATFKNNEKYSIKLYGDENNSGNINSSDIFELLNKENIDTNAIEELCNFIIKKAEFKNYSNISTGYEEFNEKSIVTPSTTPLQPAQDRYTELKNVEELKNLNAQIGDKYKTLGYYTENDGGAGRYDIIAKDTNIKIDNGLYVELNNGLVAKLSVRNETVNVKQFGALGNGKNDDTQYLRTAFNSGIANVELPKGEYKITDKINLDTPSTNIIGNDSTIFTDNDYKPEKYSEFLFVMQSNDCNISNLNIEARETENIENQYKAQVYVGATNIKIVGCSFKVPETASNEHSYSNIDLYTGWHNVLIDNCELYLANDAKEGGCIWIRDLFNRGASDVTFSNNRCYKKCHDEILAVFMGSIENVNILNNTFTMPNSTDPSTMCFTFGSNSSKQAKNIRFEGNTIDVKATMSLLHSRNANNLSIKNNNIKFEKVNLIDNGKTNTFILYFPKDNQENNSKNVIIENNSLEINNATSNDVTGILSSNAQNITFDNNKITSNARINEAFTGEIESMSNNNMTFNEYVRILINKPKKFTQNHIIFNSKFDTLVQYHSGNLDYDSNVSNNIIESNYDEISDGGKSNLLMFNGGILNNHIVTFEDNTIKSEKANYKSNLIYILNLSDTTPQTIKIINNSMSGYKLVWKAHNQEIHKIILENNT
jgi:hypothetical protein